MKIHQHFNWTFILSASLVIVAIPFGLVQAVDTHIKTDTNLTVVTPLDVSGSPGSPTTVVINEASGKPDTPGGTNNIFYSFDKFNIGAGDTAFFNFTHHWNNAIARVTDGATSFIDGTLRVGGYRTAGGSISSSPDFVDGITGATSINRGPDNFFLINPAGIIFGAGSVVDVPGSFYASTASSLKFGDGSTFGINDQGVLVNELTSATPAAFGFLGNETGSITLDHATIQVFNDATLALVGRDISIDSSIVGQRDLTFNAGQPAPPSVDLNRYIYPMGQNSSNYLYAKGFNDLGQAVDFDPLHPLDTAPRFVSKGDLFVDGIQMLLLAEHGRKDVQIFDHNPNDFPDEQARIAFNATVAQSLNYLDGTINIANTDLINAGGDAEEITFVRGGNINLTNGSIVSSNYGDDCGGICQSNGADESVPGISGIDLLATGMLTMNNGHVVTETTFTPVNPAADNVAIHIQAASMLMDNGSTISTRSLNVADINPAFIPAGIFPVPYGLNPQAGNINIKVVDGHGVYGNFTAQGGSAIESSTGTFGDAGQIAIEAGSITLNNASIKSESLSAVNGLAGFKKADNGNIDRNYFPGRDIIYTLVTENHDLYTQPFTTPSSLLPLQTPTDDYIFIIERDKNAGAAGGIDLIAHGGDITLSNGSSITTNAVLGDGGNINISGADVTWLQNSQITTSVLGAQGNGGNIDLTSNFLILESGFIQANTNGNNATGGLLNINVGTLIPSGSSLFIGGNTPLQFQPFSGINVIQAAAPSGLSGQVNTTSPQLNLSGTLASLIVQSFDPNAISRNLCAIGESSSLGQSGKGGLRRRAKDALISTNSSVSF
jgi:hypothetical protein